jgi:hypothetical protein
MKPRSRLHIFTVPLLILSACASTPPTKINSPEDYQKVVGDLVSEVIDIFNTDGTNCDMLSNDLHRMAASQKFKVAHDWGTSHEDGPKQAQIKINEKKADFEKSSGPAIHACGGGVQSILTKLVQ